jgi:hypothetical protein
MAARKDSGAAGDPFAPWRGVSEFTIEEAAHLCAGIVPGRGFRFWKDRDRAEQEEHAALAGWRKRIHDSAAELGVTTRLVPERKNYSTDIDGRQRVRSTTPAHTEFGKVTRAALVEWLDGQGARPAFFEHAADDASVPEALTTRERETLLALVAALAELAGIDLRDETAGHAEAKKLAPELLARGVRTTPETIAKKLAAGRDLIRPKGPGWATDSNSK